MSKRSPPAVPVKSREKPWLAEHLPGGITYRQLDWWIHRGWIRMPGRGSGYFRRPDEGELYIAEWMGRLTRAGLAASIAAPLAREIAENPVQVHFEIGPGLLLRLEERLDDEPVSGAG